MECNRDEASKAKSVSEVKFMKQDYAGARKFAMKAQTLYPGLDGINQLLATIDIHISFENKQGGEVDWYVVLNVNPSADETTIKKHYKKLALMLHPDKNKSVGANGAFRIISEAWNFLSDKEKRLAYDRRRAFRDAQKAQSQSNGAFNFGNRATSAPNTHAANQTPQSGSNGFHNFGNRTTQVPKAAAQSQPNRTYNAGSKTSVPNAKNNCRNRASKQKPTQPSQKPGSNGFHNFGNRTTQFPKAAAKSQPNGTSNIGSETTSVPNAQNNCTNTASKQKPTQHSQKPDHFPRSQSKPNPSPGNKPPSTIPSRQQTKPGLRKSMSVKVGTLKPDTRGYRLVAKLGHIEYYSKPVTKKQCYTRTYKYPHCFTNNTL